MHLASRYSFYYSAGEAYSNPEDTADNTNASNQQVWGIMGDSIAIGTSSTPGPTPTSGTVYEFNGTDIIEVGATDLEDANTGSPWPKFGIDYYATSRKKPVFVNTAFGGAEFYPNGDNNNWYTTGTLYAAAKTKINNALADAGTTKVRGILIILGINDIRGAQTLTNILPAVNSLVDRINTDFASPPIYFVIPGRDESVGYNSNRHQYIRRLILNTIAAYANCHIAGQLLPYANWGLYGGDNLHLTQTGNNLLGEQIARYVTNTDTNRAYKSMLASQRTDLTAAQKPFVKALTEVFASSGDFFSAVDGLHIYVNNTEDNTLIDWVGMAAPQKVNTVTFTANSHLKTNGVDSYIRTHFLQDNTAKSSSTDFIEFVKTKVVTTGSGTSAYLFGKQPSGTTLMRVYQGGGVLNAQCVDTTVSTYAGEGKFADNTIYAAARSSGTKMLKRNTTDVISAAVAASAAITTRDTWVGANNNNLVIAAPIEAEMQCWGLIKLSLVNWSNFVTALNNLLTAMQTP